MQIQGLGSSYQYASQEDSTEFIPLSRRVVAASASEPEVNAFSDVDVPTDTPVDTPTDKPPPRVIDKNSPYIDELFNFLTDDYADFDDLKLITKLIEKIQNCRDEKGNAIYSASEQWDVIAVLKSMLDTNDHKTEKFIDNVNAVLFGIGVLRQKIMDEAFSSNKPDIMGDD